MAEVQCLKIRLDDAMADEATTWFRELDGRREEITALMQREGMRVESVFVERSPEATYLYFYARAESLKQANQVFMEDASPIAAETRSIIKRTWQEFAPLEFVVDLDAPSRES